jgi:heme-degrading monooxygenase HmoA
MTSIEALRQAGVDDSTIRSTITTEMKPLYQDALLAGDTDKADEIYMDLMELGLGYTEKTFSDWAKSAEKDAAKREQKGKPSDALTTEERQPWLTKPDVEIPQEEPEEEAPAASSKLPGPLIASAGAGGAPIGMGRRYGEPEEQTGGDKGRLYYDLEKDFMSREGQENVSLEDWSDELIDFSAAHGDGKQSGYYLSPEASEYLVDAYENGTVADLTAKDMQDYLKSHGYKLFNSEATGGEKLKGTLNVYNEEFKVREDLEDMPLENLSHEIDELTLGESGKYLSPIASEYLVDAVENGTQKDLTGKDLQDYLEKRHAALFENEEEGKAAHVTPDEYKQADDYLYKMMRTEEQHGLYDMKVGKFIKDIDTITSGNPWGLLSDAVNEFMEDFDPVGEDKTMEDLLEYLYQNDMTYEDLYRPLPDKWYKDHKELFAPRRHADY